MLDNKFISYNSAKKLVDMNKIDVDNKYFIEKYKEGQDEFNTFRQRKI